jgi:hypothetical protein
VAFVEFASPQAAAAVKAKIESGSSQPMYLGKRHSVSYTNPNANPFRTLPKEAPQRDRPRDFPGAGEDRIAEVILVDPLQVWAGEDLWVVPAQG